MSHDHHHHHDGLESLAFLGILGTVLLLPSDLLRRALKRLAILVGSFVAIIAIIGGAYAVFTPKPTGCAASRTMAEEEKCREAVKRAHATHPCKNPYDSLAPDATCYAVP
jgi:hypothetical protein